MNFNFFLFLLFPIFFCYGESPSSTKPEHSDKHLTSEQLIEKIKKQKKNIPIFIQGTYEQFSEICKDSTFERNRDPIQQYCTALMQSNICAQVAKEDRLDCNNISPKISDTMQFIKQCLIGSWEAVKTLIQLGGDILESINNFFLKPKEGLDKFSKTLGGMHDYVHHIYAQELHQLNKQYPERDNSFGATQETLGHLFTNLMNNVDQYLISKKVGFSCLNNQKKMEKSCELISEVILLALGATALAQGGKILGKSIHKWFKPPKKGGNSSPPPKPGDKPNTDKPDTGKPTDKPDTDKPNANKTPVATIPKNKSLVPINKPKLDIGKPNIDKPDTGKLNNPIERIEEKKIMIKGSQTKSNSSNVNTKKNSETASANQEMKVNVKKRNTQISNLHSKNKPLKPQFHDVNAISAQKMKKIIRRKKNTSFIQRKKKKHLNQHRKITRSNRKKSKPKIASQSSGKSRTKALVPSPSQSGKSLVPNTKDHSSKTPVLIPSQSGKSRTKALVPAPSQSGESSVSHLLKSTNKKLGSPMMTSDDPTQPLKKSKSKALMMAPSLMTAPETKEQTILLDEITPKEANETTTEGRNVQPEQQSSKKHSKIKTRSETNRNQNTRREEKNKKKSYAINGLEDCHHAARNKMQLNSHQARLCSYYNRIRNLNNEIRNTKDFNTNLQMEIWNQVKRKNIGPQFFSDPNLKTMISKFDTSNSVQRRLNLMHQVSQLDLYLSSFSKNPSVLKEMDHLYKEVDNLLENFQNKNNDYRKIYSKIDEIYSSLEPKKN